MRRRRDVIGGDRQEKWPVPLRCFVPSFEHTLKSFER
jgi:hypothetical protein